MKFSEVGEAERRRPLFVADEMLGKLARWLRICGLDVDYLNPAAEDELARRAETGGRIVLTRNRKLFASLGERSSIFIDDDNIAWQLRQFFADTGLDPFERAFTRCVGCNVPFEEFPREKAEGRVPTHVFETQERYLHCPGCDGIFWSGTHRARMKQQLDYIFNPTEEEEAPWDDEP